MNEQSDSPHRRVRRVYVGDDQLLVELRNGGEIAAPLDMFPELKNASEKEKRQWVLVAMDTAIKWPDLDLQLSIDDLPPPTYPIPPSQ